MADLRHAFGEYLKEMGKKYSNVVVLDADLNTSTRTSYFMEQFPDRFFQMGLAEQNMMGVAAGMSLAEDVIPFAVTFATFASKRPCDQISVSIGYQKANVKIVGTYAGLSVGKGGATHQAIMDIAIMRAIPNINVVSPGWSLEIKEVLEASIKHQGPVYIRVEAGDYPNLKTDEEFKWGKGRVFRKGDDCTIITTGTMIHRALEAATQLEENGIEAGVIHFSSIEPIDEQLIKEVASYTKGIITIENHGIYGGLGDAVSQIITKTSPIPVIRMGINRSFGLTAKEGEELYKNYNLTANDIVINAMHLKKFRSFE